jgi:hypothetical protein
MKLKNHLQYGTWAFYIGEDEDTIRIPSEGFARNRKAIVSAVIGTFDSLASQGKPEYKENAQKEAEMMKLQYSDFIASLIEHQICVRTTERKGLCLPSGIGDRIHAAVALVDSVTEAAPTPVRKAVQGIAQKVTKALSGKATKRFSGCSSCGGTRNFSAKNLNMGRAGRMR